MVELGGFRHLCNRIGLQEKVGIVQEGKKLGYIFIKSTLFVIIEFYIITFHFRRNYASQFG